MSPENLDQDNSIWEGYYDLKQGFDDSRYPPTKEYQEKLREIARYEEMRLDCLSHLKRKDRFKKEYPKVGVDIIEAYYHDCSPRKGAFIMSFFSRFGIQKIDAWFSKEIQMEEESKHSPEELEKMIRRNPHLHNVIKTNLLENLHRYVGGG